MALTDASPQRERGSDAAATPANACDAHMHIFTHVDIERYAAVQAQLGTTRTVVVTPRPHGVDNAVTLDAIAQLGRERTRGVGVIRPDISDAELRRLHDGGIRGIRFTLYTPANAVVGFEMVEPLAQRIHAYGWHVQLHWTADQIVEHRAMLGRLPCPMVFDHMARLPQPAGLAHPAREVVEQLAAATGRVWVKLSGPYLDSRDGLDARYADVAPVARHWARTLPDRVVWGGDWPHVTETHTPDDVDLLRLLTEWVPEEAARKRILVDNPAQLYGFTR